MRWLRSWQVIHVSVAIGLVVGGPNLVSAQSSVIQEQLIANMALQYALVWTGHYDGLTDGAIGERSIAAIAAFQRERGWNATGALDGPQRDALFLAADNFKSSIEFEVVRDRRANLTIGIPRRLMPKEDDTLYGTRYASRDGEFEVVVGRYRIQERSLDELYSRVLNSGTIKDYAFKSKRRDKFFVSGSGDASDYYYSGRLDGGDVVGLSIKSPKAEKPWFGRLVVAIANTLHYPAAAERQLVARVERGGPQVQGYQKRAPATERDRGPRSPDDLALSFGSGFFVDTLGHIITNNHVVEGCDYVGVKGHDRADVVRRDPKNDMAILRVTPKSPPRSARFRREEVELGERVLAFGYPLPGVLAQSLNVTSGMVSSLLGPNSDSRLIQISAPVQSGNSGGPLVDQTGRVVGVVSWKLNPIAVAEGFGSLPENIGFALRSNGAVAMLKAAGLEPKLDAVSLTQSDRDIAKEANDYTVQIHCVSARR